MLRNYFNIVPLLVTMSQFNCTIIGNEFFFLFLDKYPSSCWWNMRVVLCLHLNLKKMCCCNINAQFDWAGWVRLHIEILLQYFTMVSKFIILKPGKLYIHSSWSRRVWCCFSVLYSTQFRLRMILTNSCLASSLIRSGHNATNDSPDQFLHAVFAS